jgi:hypothetical protein
MPDDALAAVALLGGDPRLLDQRSTALLPVAVGGEAALGLPGVLRTANARFCGAVQLLADELDDDLADELGNGPAQLVSNALLELRRSRPWLLSLRRLAGVDRTALTANTRQR